MTLSSYFFKFKNRVIFSLKNLLRFGRFSGVLLVLIIALVVLSNCENLEPERIIKIKTDTLTYISNISFQAKATLLDPGSGNIDQHGFCWGDTKEPTIYVNRILLGPKSSAGDFSETISGLLENTVYYVKAYVQSGDEVFYGGQKSILTVPPGSSVPQTSTVVDYDGNTYNTIKIGNQWWMAENLKTTHYANGTAIPHIESTLVWNDLGYADKAYCYYENYSGNANICGALYNWAAAMNGENSSDSNPSGVQGVCPSGWHLPSNAEWKQLEMNMGMSQTETSNMGYRGTNEGSKLAGNAELWVDGVLKDNSAFGISGFMAIPSAWRKNDGTFDGLGYISFFWCSLGTTGSDAWYRMMIFERTEVERGYFDKSYGISVRCAKD